MSDSNTVAVIDRKLRKYKKKIEAIKGKKDKKANGDSLNEEEKQMIASEPEVNRMIEELDSIRGEIMGGGAGDEKGGSPPQPAKVPKGGQTANIEPITRFAYILAKKNMKSYVDTVMNNGLAAEDVQNLLVLGDAVQACETGKNPVEAFSSLMQSLVKGSTDPVNMGSKKPTSTDYKSVCASLANASPLLAKAAPQSPTNKPVGSPAAKFIAAPQQPQKQQKQPQEQQQQPQEEQGADLAANNDPPKKQGGYSKPKPVTGEDGFTTVPNTKKKGKGKGKANQENNDN